MKAKIHNFCGGRRRRGAGGATASRPGAPAPATSLGGFARPSATAAATGARSPWREQRASFFFPTDTEWEAELTMVKAQLAPGGTPNLGFPLPSGALQPAFNIYAWNEFGEGGIMAPSHGWRYRRLEAIASVFGVDQAVSTQ